MNNADTISRAAVLEALAFGTAGDYDTLHVYEAKDRIAALSSVPPQVVHEDGSPTRETIAAEYLNICAEDCYGDDSVGIPACPFARWPDDDIPCLCSCALRTIIGAKMGGEDDADN